MIHTPPSLPIQSNVDLLIVYFFKHLKEDYSLLAMAYFNPIPDGVGGIHQDFTETLITRKVCAFKTWERCLNFPWFIA